jgi:hypothetical protein
MTAEERLVLPVPNARADRRGLCGGVADSARLRLDLCGGRIPDGFVGLAGGLLPSRASHSDTKCECMGISQGASGHDVPVRSPLGGGWADVGGSRCPRLLYVPVLTPDGPAEVQRRVHRCACKRFECLRRSRGRIVLLSLPPAALLIDGFYGLTGALAFLALFDLTARATPKGSEALGYSVMYAFINIAMGASDMIGFRPFGSTTSSLPPGLDQRSDHGGHPAGHPIHSSAAGEPQGWRGPGCLTTP